MKLLFKTNVNDEHQEGLVYRKGKTYDFEKKRAKEIMDKLPNDVEAVGKASEEPIDKSDERAEQAIEDNAEAELIDAVADAEEKPAKKKSKV